MKENKHNIFDYGNPNQRSYPLNNFCSAALKSLMDYAVYEQEVIAADRIVAQEHNPQAISKKLITHFDITKEGEDKISQTKRRKGQDYFRRMILINYGSRCALTGIDIPQLLIAFDEGLITISPDDYKVSLSSALLEYESEEYFDKHFASIAGKQISLPSDYKPDRDFLAYHREKVFMGI